jgi:hypothetical protein
MSLSKYCLNPLLFSRIYLLLQGLIICKFAPGGWEGSEKGNEKKGDNLKENGKSEYNNGKKIYWVPKLKEPIKGKKCA